jgi:hypothetical protein
MVTGNWLSAVIGVATAAVILYLVRRDHLHARYAMWWIPTAFGVALLGIFPQIVDWIGPKLGIHYPPVLPLILALVLVMVKILLMDIERSRNEVKLYRLIQRVAMLEAEIRAAEPHSQSNEAALSDSA